jgi:hypothetical protein
MAAIIPLILTIIQDLLPSLSLSSTVTNIIGLLVQAIPVVVKEAEDLLPMIQKLIADVQGSGVATPDQIKQLQDLAAKYDADFAAAAAKADAADAADPAP